MANQQTQPKVSQDRTSTAQKQSSNNVVGVHYKIGRKIGEGSFGIIYEGTIRLI
jgi:casein kinase 1